MTWTLASDWSRVGRVCPGCNGGCGGELARHISETRIENLYDNLSPAKFPLLSNLGLWLSLVRLGLYNIRGRRELMERRDSLRKEGQKVRQLLL